MCDCRLKRMYLEYLFSNPDGLLGSETLVPERSVPVRQTYIFMSPVHNVEKPAQYQLPT
jgi:hypothetical protein